jgi:uncharacterized membrane protein
VLFSRVFRVAYIAGMMTTMMMMMMMMMMIVTVILVVIVKTNNLAVSRYSRRITDGDHCGTMD